MKLKKFFIKPFMKQGLKTKIKQLKKEMIQQQKVKKKPFNCGAQKGKKE